MARYFTNKPNNLLPDEEQVVGQFRFPGTGQVATIKQRHMQSSNHPLVAEFREFLGDLNRREDINKPRRKWTEEEHIHHALGYNEHTGGWGA